MKQRYVIDLRDRQVVVETGGVTGVTVASFTGYPLWRDTKDLLWWAGKRPVWSRHVTLLIRDELRYRGVLT